MARETLAQPEKLTGARCRLSAPQQRQRDHHDDRYEPKRDNYPDREFHVSDCSRPIKMPDARSHASSLTVKRNDGP